MKLWLIERLHKWVNRAFALWKWAVKRESRNEKSKEKAHIKGTPGNRYMAHPVGKTARAKRGKARNR